MSRCYRECAASLSRRVLFVFFGVCLSLLQPNSLRAQEVSRQGVSARAVATPHLSIKATASATCSAPDTYTTLRSFDPEAPQYVITIDRAMPIDSGFVFGTNHYFDSAKATAFSLPPGTARARLESVNVWFAYKNTALWSEQYDLHYSLQIYGGTLEGGPAAEPLYEQKHALIDVKADNDFTTPSEATTHELWDPIEVGPVFFVAVDFGDYPADAMDRLAISSSPHLGRRVPEVFERLYEGGWYNVSDMWFGDGNQPGTNGWQLWMEATVAIESAYNGTTCLQGDILDAEGVEDYDRFGRSIAASEDYLVVGSTGTRLAGASDTEVGNLRFFVRNGSSWYQQVRLEASDQLYGEGFGSAVALSGDYAVAGAPNKGVHNVMDGAGAAYVFARTGATWKEQVRLTASDATQEDRFGASVAISGNFIAVGATGRNEPGAPDAGAVYVFERTGGPVTPWTQQAVLVPNDPRPEAGFGHAIALDGDVLVVGAPGWDHNGTRGAGAAYVFTRQNGSWVQTARLTAFDPSEYSLFGASVSVSGDHLVVGAPGADAAYVFMREGASWIHTAKIVPSEKQNVWVPDEFGASVAISDDRVLVGAPGAGVAYLFTNSGTGWEESFKLTAGLETLDFGRNVSLNRSFAFVADPDFEATMFDPYTGAVYVYALSGSPVSVEHVDDVPDQSFEIEGPYPNPFDAETRFTLQLDRSQTVSIEVFDLTGRRVAELHRGALAAGSHTFTFRAESLPAGVYLVRVTGEQFSTTRSVFHLK